MKRILLLGSALLLGTAAIAQQGNPGGNFIETWDLNEDAQVTLAEATERRSDIFSAFDADENVTLTFSEHAMFDEARSNQQDAKSQMRNQGQGQLRDQGEAGLAMGFNDVNGDGQVSRDEFIARTKDWFAQMDSNGDGIITTADFGRSNNENP